jgi:hypothetical protein
MLLLEKPTFVIVNRNSPFIITRRFVVIDNTKLELLDEKIIYQHGCYKRVKRWYRGSHPIGVTIKGFTGLETVVEQDVIVPMGVFQVINSPPNPF